MAKTKVLPTSNRKSTRSATKDKYPVAHIDINTDTHSHDTQDDPLEPLHTNSHLNIPVSHLNSLRQGTTNLRY